MLNLTYLPMLCIFRTIVVLLSQGRFLGGIAHPLEVTLSGSQSGSESVSQPLFTMFPWEDLDEIHTLGVSR